MLSNQNNDVTKVKSNIVILRGPNVTILLSRASNPHSSPTQYIHKQARYRYKGSNTALPTQYTHKGSVYVHMKHTQKLTSSRQYRQPLYGYLRADKSVRR